MKRFLFLLVSISLIVISCSDSSAAPTLTRAPAQTAVPVPTTQSTPTAAPQPQSRSLVVLAASSLAEVFPEIGAIYRRKYPSDTLSFSFASSPVLRTQIEQGAKADIFASADDIQMNAAVKSGVIEGTPTLFVKNKLVVIIPKNTPGKISKLQDLSKPGLKLVLTGPEVPVGNYARQSIAKMALDSSFGPDFSNATLKNLVSNETNVRVVVAKVVLGDADLGFCYLSDVTAATAPQVTVIPIPDQFNVIATYYVGVVKGSKNPDAAKALIDTITSEQGKQVLKKYNFNTD